MRAGARRGIWACALALGFAGGCRADIERRVAAFADEACACRDVQCAEAVQQRLMDLLRDAAEPPDDAKRRIVAALTKMGECINRLEGDVASPAP